MKHHAIHKTLAAAAAAGALSLMLLGCGGSAAQAQTPSFTLSSPDLASGSFEAKHVLKGFGCSGGNVSPALRWEHAPAGTQSFALLVHDPDAPTGSGFWHWVVLNIPASASGLPQGAGNSPGGLPAPALGGTNDFLDTGATGGNGNYGGPCPPQGDKPHRYVFTLYALAVPDVVAAASVPRTGTAALMSFVLNKGLGAAMLGKASFTATYGR